MNAVALHVESMQCASTHLAVMIVAARKDMLETHFQYVRLFLQEVVMIQQLANVARMFFVLQGTPVMVVAAKTYVTV
jgi:hypothetical protein